PSAGPPGLAKATAVFQQLRPQLDRLVSQAEGLVQLSRRHPAPVAALKAAQSQLGEQRQVALALAMTSPAFSPLAVAFLRETQNVDAEGWLNNRRRPTEHGGHESIA
ncbi:MAG: hypothetical protein C4293_18215, partial [Nitrospiraceae bacterium]